VGTTVEQQSLVLPIVHHDTEVEDDEIDKLVVLRMNQEFMKFGRQYYARDLNEPVDKFGTVLTVENNLEMGAVDIDSDSFSDWH